MAHSHPFLRVHVVLGSLQKYHGQNVSIPKTVNNSVRHLMTVLAVISGQGKTSGNMEYSSRK